MNGGNARFCLQGEIAARLVERWGLVTVDDDKREQDQAGRYIQSRQTPAQLVSEACEVAAVLVNELEKRGWIEPPPTWMEFIKFEDEETLRKRNVERASWDTLDELREIRRKAKQAEREAKDKDANGA